MTSYRHIATSFVLCLFFLIAGCSNASVPAFMEGYLWKNRILLVFTPDEQNMEYSMQLAALSREGIQDEMDKSDIVRIDIINGQRVAIDGATKPRLFTQPFQTHYNVNPNEFTLILIGKDGEEKLRSTHLVLTDTLLKIVETMPDMPTHQEDNNKPATSAYE